MPIPLQGGASVSTDEGVLRGQQRCCDEAYVCVNHKRIYVYADHINVCSLKCQCQCRNSGLVYCRLAPGGGGASKAWSKGHMHVRGSPQSRIDNCARESRAIEDTLFFFLMSEICSHMYMSHVMYVHPSTLPHRLGPRERSRERHVDTKALECELRALAVCCARDMPIRPLGH